MSQCSKECKLTDEEIEAWKQHCARQKEANSAKAYAARFWATSRKIVTMSAQTILFITVLVMYFKSGNFIEMLKLFK
jgi:hypothetical protein